MDNLDLYYDVYSRPIRKVAASSRNQALRTFAEIYGGAPDDYDCFSWIVRRSDFKEVKEYYYE